MRPTGNTTIRISREKTGYRLLAVAKLIAVLAYPRPDEQSKRDQFARALIANHLKTVAAQPGDKPAIAWPDAVTVRRNETIESRMLDQVNVRLNRRWRAVKAARDFLAYAAEHGLTCTVDRESGEAKWSPYSPGTPRKFAGINAAEAGGKIEHSPSRAYTDYSESRPVLHLAVAFFEAAESVAGDVPETGEFGDLLLAMLNEPERWIETALDRAEHLRQVDLPALGINPKTAHRIVLTD